VKAAGGIACNGIGAPENNEEKNKAPRLFVTHFVLEPGAALDQPSSSSDCLIMGINGTERKMATPTCFPRKRLRNSHASGKAISPAEQGF